MTIILITWHILCALALVILGRKVNRQSYKGLAYALALINAGYVLAYLMIWLDTI